MSASTESGVSPDTYGRASVSPHPARWANGAVAPSTTTTGSATARSAAKCSKRTRIGMASL